MMSNCAFWSQAGELRALHGPDGADPAASFAPWAAGLRLAPGRLVTLSAAFPRSPALEAPGPGWHLVGAPARSGRSPKAVDASAPVFLPAPLNDRGAARGLPPRYDHPQFHFRAQGASVLTPVLAPGEGPEGWWAALTAGGQTHQFLVRIVPHQGRLPGDGWRKMLAWTLKEVSGLRLVPLQALPSAEALAAAPAWEYRVEAGRGADAALWDVQVLPARSFWSSLTPGLGPWEATALLRLVRPGAPAPAEAWKADPQPLDLGRLLGLVPPADARLLVQNVLRALPGGAVAAAAQFFDSHVLPRPEGQPALVRHTPVPGLALGLVAALYGPRPWHEVDRARRLIPPNLDRAAARLALLEDLDRRLAEGRLSWSSAALDLWETAWRAPRRAEAQARLDAYRTSSRWTDLAAGDPRSAEDLLRSLDVTDAALCLRDAPDQRWRRFVTARREAELRAELDFCRVWEARGDLSVERQLDAWVSWDAFLARRAEAAAGAGAV